MTFSFSLTACSQAPLGAGGVQYLSVASEALDSNLVRVAARAVGPNGKAARDFARCAIARQALLRGDAYARPLRSFMTEEAGVWTADAVYTLSPDRPPGVDVVDASITVAACGAQGIPTL